MEKRTLADQGNTLVDLGKVREASEHIIFTPPPSQTSTCNHLICPGVFLSSTRTPAQMQSLMYDVLSEVQGCRGELDSHIHTLEKHVEELREGFKSLMPLLSSTLSTQNSSIRHLLREREVKTETASGSVDR